MRRHIEPLNDLRGHVTDGDPCPCMPRKLDPDMVIHNSYDGREVGDVCRMALDACGLALTGHSHQWTELERAKFEHAWAVLEMHWPDAKVEEPAA